MCVGYIIIGACILAFIYLVYKTMKHKEKYDSIESSKLDTDESTDFALADYDTKKIRTDLYSRKWTPRRYIESQRKRVPLGLQNSNRE